MSSIYFKEVDALQVDSEPLKLTLTGDDIQKKINSLRATLCQMGKRHNKKFSVRQARELGVVSVFRLA